MIKFTDVIKANGRYVLVLIISILVFFGIIFGVKYENATYEAINNSYYITKDDVKATSSETELFIQDMSSIIDNGLFYAAVVETVNTSYPGKYEWLNSNFLKDNLDFSYDKKTNKITASFLCTDETGAKTILATSLTKAIEIYKDQIGTEYELQHIYPIVVNEYKSKNGLYALIGVLVGFVIGEILITCFVAFTPYAQSKEITERVLDLNVITVLDKEVKQK